MNKKLKLTDMTGVWSGKNQLWHPPDPVQSSRAEAKVSSAARDGVVVITYSWQHAGQTEEGLLAIRTDPNPVDTDAVWFDSWHTCHKFMQFCREPDFQDHLLAVRGTYAVPSGPDWGWRILLHSDETDRFVIRMYNVTPDGGESLAVETAYVREGLES